MFTGGGLSSFQNLGHLPCAMCVRVLREDALQRGVADAARGRYIPGLAGWLTRRVAR